MPNTRDVFLQMVYGRIRISLDKTVWEGEVLYCRLFHHALIKHYSPKGERKHAGKTWPGKLETWVFIGFC